MASDYLILRAEPPALRLRPPPAPISENSYTAGGAAEAMGEEGLSYGLFVSCRVKRETEERRDYRISSGSNRPLPSDTATILVSRATSHPSFDKYRSSIPAKSRPPRTRVIDCGHRPIAALVSCLGQEKSCGGTMLACVRPT